MTFLKKALSIILTLAVMLTVLPFGLFSMTASAATTGETGDCTWSLDGTTLTISGNGVMGDGMRWDYGITTVIIEEGVSVGAMSLVNKSLNKWNIYIGIPCKKLKERKKDILELEDRLNGNK